MRWRILIAPLIAAAVCLSAAAADPVIEVVVTPRLVTVGEPVSVRVSVTHDAGLHMGDVVMSELGEDLQRVGPPSIEPSEEQRDGSTIEVWQAEIVAFDTGDLALPDVSMSWMTSDGFSGEVNASLGTLTVETVLPLGVIPGEPKPLHGPFLMEPERFPWLWSVLIGAVVAIAAWILWRFLRRPRDVNVPVRARRIRPAHELALEDLDALEQSSLIADGNHRAFFFSLTDIVRMYFGREFGIGAPEMTSHELLDALTEESFPSDLCDQVRRWISACDLVKFASQHPRPDHCQNAISLGRKIVVDAHQHRLLQIRQQEEARAA